MHHRTETKIAFRDSKRHRRGTEALIRFLEKDEYRHRTGYAKEYAWHLLKTTSLNGTQRRRLRAIALRYLHKRMNRESWYMCRFIHRIADDGFRSQVAMLIQSKDELVGKRASLLQAYLEGPVAGEGAHREFQSECRSREFALWLKLMSGRRVRPGDGKQEPIQGDCRQADSSDRHGQQ